ncbi:Hypothetical protein A7982_11785 [Minicystis rosea]|nr:Hypothetical protein A7982_11785 [Minicystis rosea]
MTRTLRRFGLPSLLLLLPLLGGCASRALVGVEDSPEGSSECEGACPAPIYTAGLHAGWSEILDLAIGDDGSSVFVGRFAGEMTVGDTTLEASNLDGSDGFIIKLDPTGKLAWARQTLCNPNSFAVAVRPGGEIWVAGGFNHLIDLGTGPLISEGEAGLFIGEFLSDGTVGNARAYDGSSWVNDLALTTNGDLVITGVVEAPTKLGFITIKPAGSFEGARNGFVARLDSSGDAVWARRLGDAVYDAVALPDDAVALVGEYTGLGNIGGLTLPSEDLPNNTFLAVFDDAGSPVWAQRVDPTPDAPALVPAYAPTLALAPDGKLALAFLSFPPLEELTPSDQRLHVQTFESNGSRASHVDLGSGSVGRFMVAVAPDGDIVVGGSFDASLEIGGATLASPNSQDGWLARFSPAGSALRWAKGIGAPTSSEVVIRVGVTPNNHPLVGGLYVGSFAIDDEELPLTVVDNENGFIASFEP